MSAIAVSNICMFQGEIRSLPGTVTQDGIAVDISGDDLEFQVKKAIDDADPAIIIKSVTLSSVTIVSGPAGTFTVDFVTADTSSIDPGVYQYSVVWLPDTGGRIVVVPPESTFTLLQSLNPA